MNKVLYVHGFASSGASGSVKWLREHLHGVTVVAPDLPTEPLEAIDLLKRVAADEQPDLVIGTSMGGMLAEQLHGFDRILVNPAFEIAETLRTNMGLGMHTFHNPRQDGKKEFLVTKKTLEAFREVTSHCFEKTDEEEQGNGYHTLVGESLKAFLRTEDTGAQHHHDTREQDEAWLQTVGYQRPYHEDQAKGYEIHIKHLSHLPFTDLQFTILIALRL